MPTSYNKLVKRKDIPALTSANYDDRYMSKYPRGLDFSPDSELHRDTLGRLMRMAQTSRDIMGQFYGRWQEIDRTLTAYVNLDEEEQDTIDQDSRKPTSFVIPVSYGIMDTYLTYLTSVFLDQPPVFRFEPRGPEDVLGTILLEQQIDADVTNSKIGLSLHTFWRDSLAYGIGAVECEWDVREGKRTVFNQETIWDEELKRDVPTGNVTRSRVKDILFEGNALRNIDPYMYLPDPSVPFQDVQEGEFVGYGDSSSRVNFLLREQEDPKQYFNARYLEHIDGKSFLFSKEDERDGFGASGYQEVEESLDEVKPIQYFVMYATIIPSEWGFGDKDAPEKWGFVVAGDALILRAAPLDLDHGMYPIAVCAPDYDGYSTVPNSRLSVSYPVQKTVDWLISIMEKAQNTSINGKLLIDPSIYNINDLKQNRDGQGWIVRKRRRAWGQDVKGWDAINVPDFTQNNMGNALSLVNMMKEHTGAVDSLQGVMRAGGERRSATEARDTRVSALSRLARIAKIISIMGMRDIGFIFASHTQQFLRKESSVRTTGRWEEVLRDEFSIDVEKQKYYAMKPQDLAIRYDVIPHDGTGPGTENIETWSNIFQIIMQAPEFAQQNRINTLGVFKHLARLSGAKNLNDFIMKGGQAEVAPDEQILQMLQQGAIAPAPGGRIGG